MEKVVVQLGLAGLVSKIETHRDGEPLSTEKTIAGEVQKHSRVALHRFGWEKGPSGLCSQEAQKYEDQGWKGFRQWRRGQVYKGKSQ